jgi:26S proteasome regulatory subunit T5
MPGLDKQIQELVEAVERPITHSELFKSIGIKPPKGVLLWGPPGTGKTMLARACAAKTKSCFLKLAAPQLVQMFIGDGAKLVRDAFALAREKAPAIIFIDELDAIGTKRFDSDKSGDREVQRTMLELLNQLDGFSSDDRIKVMAATNRPDILDPALLRSGRLDRKVEFPLPDEEGRANILRIHSNKMNVNFESVNFEELARCTDDFNGQHESSGTGQDRTGQGGAAGGQQARQAGHASEGEHSSDAILLCNNLSSVCACGSVPSLLQVPC